MELRTRIGVIIGITCLFIFSGAIAVGLWSRLHITTPIAPVVNNNNRVVLPDNPPAVNQQIIVDQPDKPVVVEPVVPQPSAQDLLKSDLTGIAATFAERFGSYSNQGNYDNIDSLRFLMTLKMNKWGDEYVNTLKAAPQPATQLYYGVTTKTLSTTIEAFDTANGLVTILVTTQRKEIRGATANAVLVLQTLRLSFIKEDGFWKVDSAKWGGKEAMGN